MLKLKSAESELFDFLANSSYMHKKNDWFLLILIEIHLETPILENQCVAALWHLIVVCHWHLINDAAPKRWTSWSSCIFYWYYCVFIDCLPLQWSCCDVLSSAAFAEMDFLTWRNCQAWGCILQPCTQLDSWGLPCRTHCQVKEQEEKLVQ